VRIVNANDHAVPMYWWSNIAVPEADDVRVLAPGDAAWRFDETATVDLLNLPVADGTDRTYPAAAPGAADYFVRLEPDRRPWVAAVNGSGLGLVQSSTAELRGRKLFVWGSGAGGRHWQEWLSPLGGRYLEIQAGLLRTQLEHVSMPAHTEWSWVETYGPVEVDPTVAHGADWAAAREAAEDALTTSVPDAWLAARRAEADALAERPPTEMLHEGSGWGALAARMDGSLVRTATPFPGTSMGAEQAAWLALLEEGALPPADPRDPPPSYLVSAAWAERLEQSPADDWLTWLHRGVARHHAGDVAAAADAWRRSHTAAPNAWALRNLAVVAVEPADAAEQLAAAWSLAPSHPALLVELLEALLADGRATEALAAVDAADPDVAADPLVQFLAAQASVAAGELNRAERVLAEVGMPWVREGSRSVDDLWFRLEAARVASSRGVPVDEAVLARVRAENRLPYAYDFRMSPDPGAEDES
jgi:hypothetical protein